MGRGAGWRLPPDAQADDQETERVNDMRTPQEIIGRNALTQLGSAGHAVVPTKPTDLMALEGACAAFGFAEEPDIQDVEKAADIYRAMIAVCLRSPPAP